MVAAHPYYNAAKLKARVNLIDFAQAHGLAGRMSGRAFVACTPWRDDHNPSLSIYPDAWLDRANGERGDVFSYVQFVGFAHGFADALAYVANWLGDSGSVAPLRVVERDSKTAAVELPDKDTQARFSAFVAVCAGYLNSAANDASDVLDYLHKRGLTDATIRAARIGYHNGAGGWKIAPGVVLPWQTSDGLIALRIRRRVGALSVALGIPADVDRDGQCAPKYSSATGSKPSAGLYDASAAIGVVSSVPDAPILWVEGEFDALCAAQTLGTAYCVVTRGSASAGISAALAAQFTGRIVYLALDSDDAGQVGRDMLIKALHKAGAELFAVTLPNGIKDINDALLAGHDLTALIAQAQRVERPAASVSSNPTPNTNAQPTAADALHCGKPLSGYARSALLNIADPFAQLAELMAETQIGVNQPATVANFFAASETSGAGLSVLMIRRSLAWAVEKGAIIKLSLRITLQGNEPSSSKGQNDNNPGGRPQDAYQLADVETLRIVFRRLAELPAVKRRFADQGIAPSVRADVLATYAPDAVHEADALRTALQCAINAQPGYSRARQMAGRDVNQHVNALVAPTIGATLGAPYPNLRAYRVAVLRRFVEQHDGEQMSCAYLAKIVNASDRRVVELLESGGIASAAPAPIEVTVPISAARAVAQRVAKTGRAAYDHDLKAQPVAFCSGSERVYLDKDATDATERVIAAAERQGTPLVIEYKGADHRRVDTPVMPVQPSRKRSAVPRVKSSGQRVERDETIVAPVVELPAEPQPVQSRIEKQWPDVSRKIMGIYLKISTSWHVDGERLNNADTGETLPNTSNNVIALLLGKPASDVYEYVDPVDVASAPDAPTIELPAQDVERSAPHDAIAPSSEPPVTPKKDAATLYSKAPAPLDVLPATVELPVETLAVQLLPVLGNTASIAANRPRRTLKTCPRCGMYTDAPGALCYECDKPGYAGHVIEKTHVNLRTLTIDTVWITI